MTTKTIQMPDHPYLWGLVLGMLHPNSDTPLWEQIHNNYQHGGGWRTQDEWEFEINGRMATAKYPGDPVMTSDDHLQIGDEHLYLFPFGYILWVGPNDDMKMARID